MQTHLYYNNNNSCYLYPSESIESVFLLNVFFVHNVGRGIKLRAIITTSTAQYQRYLCSVTVV